MRLWFFPVNVYCHWRQPRDCCQPVNVMQQDHTVQETHLSREAARNSFILLRNFFLHIKDHKSQKSVNYCCVTSVLRHYYNVVRTERIGAIGASIFTPMALDLSLSLTARAAPLFSCLYGFRPTSVPPGTYGVCLSVCPSHAGIVS